MTKRFTAIWVVLSLLALAPRVESASRYQSMLATSAGRDSLLRLSLWEDGRVTGKGKLFDYLGANNPLVRLRAVEVIGRIQDPQDVPRVLPLLKDADGRVVREAIFALGQIGSAEATPPLLEINKTAPADLQEVIAEALGKIGGEEAVAELTGMLSAFQGRVRSAAVLGLARAADPSALNALIVAIRDGDAKVAARAIYALEKIESERVVKSVVPFLENRDPKLRAQAARTLGRQRDDDVDDDLIACLNDPDETVLINTIDALARILEDKEEKKVVEPLGSLVAKHTSHHVRKAAVMALGQIGHKNAKNYLAQSILDRQPGIRAESYKALAKVLDQNAAVFIVSGLQDGDRTVRAAAAEALGLSGDENQTATLIEIAQGEEDPMIRAAAVRAMANLKKEDVVPTLIAKLTDEDYVVATEAATALGELEATDAVPSLIERFTTRHGRTDQDVRLAIMESLVKLEAKQAAAIALDALQDSDKRLRTLAAELLDKLEVAKPPIPSDREIYERDFDRARKGGLSLPLGTVTAIIRTEYGDIEVELFGDDATQTVENFIRLTRAGKYNGLTFHRVVANFVVQGGCPRGDGWGDQGYNIRSEFNQHHYLRGTLGIAHAGKDTGGSQFFITHSSQPHLDGRYTVFGRVTKGMEVVDAIKQGDKFQTLLK